MKTVATLVTALLCSTAVFAHERHDHKHVAKSLQKRFSGQATYYYVGLGACGQTNVASDFIVALNTPQYGGGSPGPECFKEITITAGGKSTNAKIMDECPSCDYGSLDMSEGLFQFFNPLSVGEFPITWEYGSGGGGDDTPTTTTTHTTPHHTTTHTTPTTTKQPTTTHSTTRTTPTTTSTKTTPTTTTTRVSTSTTTSSAAATTTSSPPDNSGNLENLNEVILDMVNFLAFAAAN